MIRTAQWLLFATLCGVSLTTWCEGSWTVTWVLAIVLACAILLRIGQAGFSEVSRSAQAVQWILLAAVGWAFVQAWMQWTVYRYETVVAATGWCATAGLFFVCAQAFGRKRDLWMERFVIFAGAIAVLCLAQRFSSNGRFLWLWDTGYLDIYGPFASYKDHAALMELAFPMALLGAIDGGPRRWIFTAVAGLMVASVVMSTSRAGSVLIAIEVVFTCVLQAMRKPKSRRSLAVGGALMACVAISLSAAAGWDRLWSRMHEKDPYAFRRQVLTSAVEMVRERPLTGFGMGNFPTAYPAYAHFDDGTWVNHAHNEWVEWAVEGGVPFALAMVLMAALAARPAVQTIWGIGLIAVLLHAVVDYPLRRFGVAGWFFFMLAGLQSAHQRPRVAATRRSTSFRVEQPVEGT